MLFFRQFQHLLPRSTAWRLTIAKTLRNFFVGLSGWGSDFKDFVDAVHGDVFPDTTRELAEWERQFGIEPNPVENVRRLNLAAEWAAGGGQSPRYLQDVLQTAGFDIYVHEWWSSGPPWVARDPRSYTLIPAIGTVQCGPANLAPECGEFTAQCNRLLANDPGYIQNDDLSQRAPPPVPDDPDAWRYFLYFGGETFPDPAVVPIARKAELRRLILKLRPTQQWIVLLVDYQLETFNVIVGGDNVVVGGDQVVVT
jgi:hypothetical protein